MRIEANNWRVIAGPCAAENPEQILETAKSIKKAGADVLRAGLWKPRTRATAWQGAGKEGLAWMQEARKQTGIALTTEVKDMESPEAVLKAEFEIVWIGSRNGMSYPLLEETGRQTAGTQVILKRTMAGDLDEWVGAAEYIAKHNPEVVLCERGIKGFPRDTRNVLDLQIAKLAQITSGLPVIIDVSHAAGRRDLIMPMAMASKAAGFNGLMVEVHPNPVMAKSDAKQQISLTDFELLMGRLALIPNGL